jgi:hypothetical protein
VFVSGIGRQTYLECLISSEGSLQILYIPLDSIYIMQQALNEQAKIDQKLVFDGLNSRLNVKVVQVLEKNECGFYNIRVKLTEDNKLDHHDDELVQDKMTKIREVTDFMVI